ncbi:MAG: MarR family transcriptional regulator [Actinobacteria bacterium]|nr:MarR family transcriptional regulator [Actinomycetota bacterium]
MKAISNKNGLNDEKMRFRRLLDIMHEAMSRLSMEHMAPHTFGTEVNLHRAEIHMVQAIGEKEGINITELANQMNITKGAVSQTVSKLAKKKIIKKSSPGDNSKEVRLYLTEKGWTGFENHNMMHMQMYDTVKKYFGAAFDKKIAEFLSVMEDLNSILRIMEKEK